MSLSVYFVSHFLGKPFARMYSELVPTSIIMNKMGLKLDNGCLNNTYYIPLTGVKNFKKLQSNYLDETI